MVKEIKNNANLAKAQENASLAATTLFCKKYQQSIQPSPGQPDSNSQAAIYGRNIWQKSMTQTP